MIYYYLVSDGGFEGRKRSGKQDVSLTVEGEGSRDSGRKKSRGEALGPACGHVETHRWTGGAHRILLFSNPHLKTLFHCF